MTTADLRLSRDQEKALREAADTGYWWPGSRADHLVAQFLKRHGLFDDTGWPGYRITAAGRDWLALHPTEVAR